MCKFWQQWGYKNRIWFTIKIKCFHLNQFNLQIEIDFCEFIDEVLVSIVGAVANL